MNTYELPISAVKAHLLISPKSDVRFYLNGVYLDTATGRMVSTDGSIMLVSRHEGLKSDGPPVIVPRDALAAAVKMTGKRAETLAMDIEQDTGTIKITFRPDAVTSTSCAAIDGRYPDYQRVIPASVDGIAGGYDPVLLERLGSALQAMGGCKSQQQVRVYQNGPDKAAWIVLDDTVGAVPHIGVIMPLRARNAMSQEAAAASVAALLAS